MAVTSFYAFELPCSVCNETFHVGPSAQFIEDGDGGEWTAYFKPQAESARVVDVVGTSTGDGESFACLACRPFKQLGSPKRKKAKPKK